MIHVLKDVRLKGATDSGHGNVQTFLERLLVEVVAGNYRYFLHEHLLKASDAKEEPEAYCWPPLLANERQVSGLFTSALATVCPVSRPEYTIKKLDNNSGRVDYFATYGNRAVALELKQKPISTIGDISGKGGLAQRWNDVSDQAVQALHHLRSTPSIYPHPVAVGLLVIRVSIKVTAGKKLEDARKTAAGRTEDLIKGVSKALRPDFLASYTPPQEMQTFLRGTEQDESRVFPGVLFAAYIPSHLSKKE